MVAMWLVETRGNCLCRLPPKEAESNLFFFLTVSNVFEGLP